MSWHRSHQLTGVRHRSARPFALVAPTNAGEECDYHMVRVCRELRELVIPDFHVRPDVAPSDLTVHDASPAGWRAGRPGLARRQTACRLGSGPMPSDVPQRGLLG